jgi:NADPH:quinone reductase-like Zn-dependent oxidoreductase
MKYAPINPSDLHFYLGRYGIKKDNFPIMGFEGSGVVYHADDASLKGKTVSVLANMTNGTYGEYICSNMDEVIVWPMETSLSQQ